LAVNATTDGLDLPSVRKGTVADHPELPGPASVVTDEVIAARDLERGPRRDRVSGLRATRRHWSSMLHNLASGGRTNVDATGEVIAERARSVGRKAGLCATLAASIRVRERYSGGDGRDGR
jgi:ketopantoate reductase